MNCSKGPTATLHSAGSCNADAILQGSAQQVAATCHANVTEATLPYPTLGRLGSSAGTQLGSSPSRPHTYAAMIAAVAGPSVSPDPSCPAAKARTRGPTVIIVVVFF